MRTFTEFLRISGVFLLISGIFTVQAQGFVKEELTEAVLEEGVHYMILNRDNGKAMDVEGRSIENGASIVLSDPEDVIPQLWRGEDQGSGYFLVNAYTDKVVKESSGEITQERDGSSSTHTWILEHVEESFFRFINEDSDNVLSVSGDDVVAESETGSSTQEWEVLRVTHEPETPEFSIEGFATVGDGTTGGLGGDSVTVSSAEELIDYIHREEPYVIFVDGVIEMPEGDAGTSSNNMHNVFPDKTIVGLEGAHIKYGGFNIKGTRNDGEGEVTRTNVIIRNLTFSEAEDDCINVTQGAMNVWIDHNTFSNSNDGLVDIKRESNYVTVSWNEFFDHHKTMLLGHDESHTYDEGFLRVTYHHNYFHETHSRHPRIRYGRAHVYNNYFTNIDGYVIGPGIESSTISENNHVWISNRFTDWYDNTGVVMDQGMGSLLAHIDHDHDLELNSVQPDWTPEDYYEYTLNSALNVKDMVTEYAGAGVIEGDESDVVAIRESSRSEEQGLYGDSDNPVSFRNNLKERGILQYRLSLKKESPVDVSIFSVTGRIVKGISLTARPGDNVYDISIKDIRSGVYIIFLRLGNDEVYTDRIKIFK